MVKILVDPVLSGSASPLKFTTKSFRALMFIQPMISRIQTTLFISHDHWDHLDHQTVLKLKPKIKDNYRAGGHRLLTQNTGNLINRSQLRRTGMRKVVLNERKFIRKIPFLPGIFQILHQGFKTTKLDMKLSLFSL